MENKSGDKFSPWRTPVWQGKQLDSAPLIETQDFAFKYMFLITSRTLPDIPSDSNFDHNLDLLTVNNCISFNKVCQSGIKTACEKLS